VTPLVGHAATLAAFDEALTSGKLHHGWLLAGPEGVGKALAARHLAARLLGLDARARALLEAGTHPDFHVIRREIWTTGTPPRIVPLDERKEGDQPSKVIRVPQIRALQPILGTSPAMGERRVILIDAADDMERPSANALLKNLEEPPAGTVFLLVSHAPGRLLPTIRSRCRLLRFDPLSDAEVRRALDVALPDVDDLETLVTVADGSPGQAIRYAGLDIAGLDAALSAIAAGGDHDNALRLKLARALAPRTAQPRYEAYLDRAARFLADAARRRTGEPLRVALDAHAAARDLAGAALGLSLDAQATAIEMAGIVARLHPSDAAR